MQRLKEITLRLLYPGKLLTVMIPLVGFALLAAVFYFGLTESPLAYGSYVLAFYSLIVVILALVPLVGKAIQFYRIRSEKKAYHIRKSLLSSLTINGCYALFNLFSGIWYQSVWLVSTGLYYLILSLIRLLLVRYERKQAQLDDPAQQALVGWRGFRACGFLLLALNMTMTGMVFQTIWRGEGSNYPGFVVYAVAAYTFYRLITAIIRVMQNRKNKNPIQGAARNISMTAAMMSLYSLQVAMLNAFGSEQAELQHLMNSLSGGAVCLLVILGAVGMILHSRKRKKELERGIL